MYFCSFASGSSGNCMFAGTEHTSVLIDLGVSKKKVTGELKKIDRKPEEIDAILITHEHSDHIRGLSIFAKTYEIPIYCTCGTRQAILADDHFESVDQTLFHEIRADECFCINDLDVLPFHVMHDAAEPVAFRLNHGDKSMAVVTDLGDYDEYTVSNLQNLEAVLIEANHDVNMLQVGRYPYSVKQRILSPTGHLSNDNAGRILSEILNKNMKEIYLGHISRENNYEPLALATVRTQIDMNNNPFKADDFPIQMARRDEATKLIFF